MFEILQLVSSSFYLFVHKSNEKTKNHWRSWSLSGFQSTLPVRGTQIYSNIFSKRQSTYVSTWFNALIVSYFGYNSATTDTSYVPYWHRYIQYMCHVNKLNWQSHYSWVTLFKTVFQHLFAWKHWIYAAWRLDILRPCFWGQTLVFQAKPLNIKPRQTRTVLRWQTLAYLPTLYLPTTLPRQRLCCWRPHT